MATKERDMHHPYYCDEHSGQCEVVELLKERQDKMMDIASRFVSSRMAWAFFVVFLGIAASVVGFLWHGQTSIANRVDKGLSDTLSAIHVLDTKVQIVDYKVEKHLDDTDELRKRIEKRVEQKK